jgi:hypothetical protein
MPNLLEFDTPVAFPSITHVSISEANGVNDTKKTITLELELHGTNIKFSNKIALQISNGAADRLVIAQNPTTHQEIFQVERVSDETVVNAFDQVMYAYTQTGLGLEAVLNTLVNLGLIPDGTT